MIEIKKSIIKKQHNFWNHALFHPTDAVEDPWGRRILDRMAEDGAVKTIRIYSMFEDIVYIGGDGELCYDFRVSDLRLDYLIDKGYELLIAYAGIPDFLAGEGGQKLGSVKQKTRYKGKMWNSSPPKDYAVWEEICYEYTKHIVERYGIETVSKWRMQCFNEPDHNAYLYGGLPKTEEVTKMRLEAYCKLYAGFEKGIRRVSDEIHIGGPTLASEKDFLRDFLEYVKENRLKLDYIAFHNYGLYTPRQLNAGENIAVEHLMKKHSDILEVIEQCGFEDTEIIVDEWGAVCSGFLNKEECPKMIFRENEVYSAFYEKLIRQMIDFDHNISKMVICLSGQHEMTEDFTGFRNFFTLNFIAKPIYNAYVLASKLGTGLLAAISDDTNISIVPTKIENGDYAVILSYSSMHFEEDIPDKEEAVVFEEDIKDKTVTVWCIDRNTTNPYRLYEKNGISTPDNEEVKLLREEGRLKPVKVQNGSEPLTLKLTANATYLILVTE